MRKIFSIILLLTMVMTSGADEFSGFVFGFNSDDALTLRAKFNDAILSMKLDGTMTILQEKYLYDQDTEDLKPESFRTYNAADTIRIALTDETKTCFNMAVMAEINRRLRVNIEIINTNADEQINALISGKADAVLWHKSSHDRYIALSETY